MNLIDYIPTGRENAIPAEQLVKMTGLKNTAMLRQEIHKLRETGALILSATDPPYGYFLTTDSADIARYIRSMESRARKIFLAVRAAKKYLSAIPDDDQIHL